MQGKNQEVRVNCNCGSLSELNFYGFPCFPFAYLTFLWWTYITFMLRKYNKSLFLKIAFFFLLQCLRFSQQFKLRKCVEMKNGGEIKGKQSCVITGFVVFSAIMLTDTTGGIYPLGDCQLRQEIWTYNKEITSSSHITGQIWDLKFPASNWSAPHCKKKN